MGYAAVRRFPVWSRDRFESRLRAAEILPVFVGRAILPAAGLPAGRTRWKAGLLHYDSARAAFSAAA